MMFTTYAMLVPLWFGTATAAERCAFGPPAHPRPTPGEPARILFEMRIPNETPSAQIDAALKPLVQDSIPVLLLFSTGWTPDTPGWRPPIGTVEVGVWAPAGSLFETEVADWGAISDADWRTAFKDAKRRVFNATQSRPVAVASPPLPPAGEVALDDRGFSVFLVDDPTNTDLPRRARSFGNRMGRARVITEGVTSDSCGARLGTPSPSALDRVTRTAPSQVVSRVAIGPNPEESRAIALWWKAVAAPADWKAWSVRTAFMRLGTSQLAPKVSTTPPRPQAVVETEHLQAAARAIIAADRLPRTLPGGLNLTEAFVGLTALAAEPGHPRYTIPVVTPPTDPSQSMLREALSLDPADLQATARQILPSLERQAPGLVNVGPHTLSTGELLVALAHVALDQPPVAHPVRSPDPYAPGGGWGSVRSP